MEYKIFSLGANDELAGKIATRIGKPLGKIKCRSFSGGEQQIQFLENLRGKNIYIVQPTNPPAENWVRLLLAIDARQVFIPHFKEFFKSALSADEFVVVSPDAGGVVRAQSYGKRLMKDGELAIIHKERDIPNQIARMKLIGDVKGKIALIVDDMADTCGTLSRAADLLVENGAQEVYALASHGVLSGKANETLDTSPIKKMFITDTILHEKLSPKLEVVSVAEIFGDAIRRIQSGESLSALFEAE